jgi:hypothetical protein
MNVKWPPLSPGSGQERRKSGKKRPSGGATKGYRPRAQSLEPEVRSLKAQAALALLTLI